MHPLSKPQNGLSSPDKFTVSPLNREVQWKTDWKSIYIVAIVAFLSSVNHHSMSIWPYLQLLDRSATETFYGYMRSISGVGMMMAAIVSGYLVNYLRDTKWPMVFAKILAICSCILYVSIEVLPFSVKWSFFTFEFIFGMSTGAASMFRTHIAMASTEEDRPRAVGICSLAPGLGTIIGPLMQLGFTLIAYPGINFLFGTHINVFTAPMIVTILISLVGLNLLLCCFDGRMKAHMGDKKKKEKQAAGSEKQQKFDWIAVAVCILTRMATMTTMISFHTISTPYSMIVFRWSSADAVKYHAVIVILIGIQVIGWNVAYIFFNLRKRLSERKGIIISMCVLMVTCLLTYPWPFLTSTIAYEDEVFQNRADISKYTYPEGQQQQQRIESREQPLGCPRRFAWCASTPAVNEYIFIGSNIITLGMALPLGHINLDILFSKVLGDIKQGTMQGMFIACGDGLHVLLPILISQMYVIGGPVHIWQALMGMIALCILSWCVFYARMIPNTRRIGKIVPH